MSLIKTAIAKTVLLVSVLVSGQVFSAFAENTFTVEDYFELSRFLEVEISSAGGLAAFTVERESLQKNSRTRVTSVVELSADADFKILATFEGARNLEWIPNTKRLAFLSGDALPGEVLVYDVDLDYTENLSITENRIQDFSFSPHGEVIAYTVDRTPKQKSLFQRFRDDEAGVLIDLENTSLFDFVNPGWQTTGQCRENEFYVARIGEVGHSSVSASGFVRSFEWSPDGSLIWINSTTSCEQAHLTPDFGSSVLLYELVRSETRTLAPFSEQEGASNESYIAQSWTPDSEHLLLRRVSGDDVWKSPSFPQWTFVKVSEGAISTDEHEWFDFEVYGSEIVQAITPRDNQSFFANVTREATSEAFTVNEDRSITAFDELNSVSGSVSHLRFNRDQTVAVFTAEAINEPPELYLWRKGYVAEKVTTENSKIAEKSLPEFQSITWTSDDGTEIQGWFLDGRSFEQNRAPLLTFIHGGPGLAMPNAFARYFRSWPYPLEVLPSHGISVFLPNYRGTKTFGEEFANPSSLDREPVEDILSGIEELIDRGWVDEDRLAIAGQSHGAWLGPLVAAERNTFTAASFAEGWGNMLSVYDGMNGRLNKHVHDRVNGVSPYDDTKRYLELSPQYSFTNIQTPFLFEGGAYYAASIMLGMAKAAKRADVPVEFRVYPRTGHIITEPRLKLESATRNLNWFLFWLKDETGHGPDTIHDYDRWNSLKKTQCATGELGVPAFCRPMHD